MIFFHFAFADYGRNHVLSVIVQILEQDFRVTTHFYGLIKLGSSASAQIQKDKLIERFRNDGLLEAMKQKAVALVVDGKSYSLQLRFSLIKKLF